MDRHLTIKAGEWFDDQEQWSAFVELSDARQSIIDRWFSLASDAIRQHFCKVPAGGWEFTAWDGQIDTWWHLREFGVDSIGIGFGWKFHLVFGARGGRFDRQRVSALIAAQPELQEAFGTIHSRDFYGFAWGQERCFSFGGPNDGRMPEPELAWHAGHNRAAFVAQAIAKIDRFVRDPIVTATIRRLNQDLLQPMTS